MMPGQPAKLPFLFDVRALGDLVYERERGGGADLAVVVPLYNYANYVAECIESVLDQDHERVSLVVIDDCSSDGGAEVAIRCVERRPDRLCSVRVVRHRRNQGLAMARNAGITWSTEPLLFMLDADNRIRRPALSRLCQAMRASGADFTYSHLHFFGEESRIGDAWTWDPLRLARGNYVDAMALIRRDALMAVGGYQVSAIQHGWEDYDLWCKFAEQGFHGVFLPEMLCEYRIHQASMLLTSTNLLAAALHSEMVLRHPALFSESPAAKGPGAAGGPRAPG